MQDHQEQLLKELLAAKRYTELAAWMFDDPDLADDPDDVSHLLQATLGIDLETFTKVAQRLLPFTIPEQSTDTPMHAFARPGTVPGTYVIVASVTSKASVWGVEGWAVEETCEGCSEPATSHDVEGVPLCGDCFASLETYGEETHGEEKG